ncbi:MAG: type II toxin-antitoxin system RelE/ParE family toxin [Bdellovibrionota bacterium]
MLEILKQCSRELDEWPEDVRGELADAVARLERGHMLSMPLSRPMPSIGRGVHELRFRDKSGIYRVVYWLAGAGRVWLIHAFKKKSQATPQQNIETAKERLKRILK